MILVLAPRLLIVILNLILTHMLLILVLGAGGWGGRQRCLDPPAGPRGTGVLATNISRGALELMDPLSPQSYKILGLARRSPLPRPR